MVRRVGLTNMAVDDIIAGRGTVGIDPHGDMVLDTLDRLPASTAGRVLLFDLRQPKHALPQSSFDMGDILNGGALLVRIPKGQLGEDTTKLLGSLVLAQVWQATTARANTAPDRRRDATLIIDECVRQEAL
jgi:hypothetical protein